MPFILLGFVLLMPLLFVVMLPLSILQRYRMGTARRLGRPLVATLNVFMIGLSILLFLAAAVAMSVWVPKVILYAIAGITGGGVLGLLGLKLTRWEPTARTLHYTPHRTLVLIITLVVAARILYGFWRAAQAWNQAGSGVSWLLAAGLPGSVAVGGIVLGYYLVYWAGVARRVRGHRLANSWVRVNARAIR